MTNCKYKSIQSAKTCEYINSTVIQNISLAVDPPSLKDVWAVWPGQQSKSQDFNQTDMTMNIIAQNSGNYIHSLWDEYSQNVFTK